MFGKSRLDRVIKDLQYQVGQANDRYWELREDHARLLDHLGLQTVVHPQKTKLAKVEECKGLSAT